MIATIAASEPSAHWYDWDATPRHFTVGANGKQRPTTLRDARQHGLLPSVTSILKLWPADNLIKWKRSQDILAAATQPRNGETDEEWVEKVIECADEIAAKARAIGTRRHDLLHKFHGPAQAIDTTSEDYPFLEPYFAWMREHVSEILNAEFIVVNRELGYAGTVDVLCRMKNGYDAIIDVKNRRKARTYVEDILQLTAYQHALGTPAEIISIVLGTERPEIYVEQWLGSELAWKRFLLCFDLWKESKEYNPISKTSLANDLASLPF